MNPKTWSMSDQDHERANLKQTIHFKWKEAFHDYMISSYNLI